MLKQNFLGYLKEKTVAKLENTKLELQPPKQSKLLELIKSYARDRVNSALTASSNSFSDLETTTVATPLPIKFVTARASDMKRSTPINNAIPSTGIIGNAAKVAAKVMNPEPVTPAAPLDVIIKIPSKVII